MNNSIYSITSTLIGDEITFNFTQRLSSLNMLFDYTNYIFPIIYLDVLFTLGEYKKFLSMGENVRIVLSLTRYKTSSLNTDILGSSESCFTNKTFVVVNGDNYYLTKPTKNEIETYSDLTNLIKIRLVLISEDDLNSNKSNLYGCYEDCTMKSLLSYLMNQVNVNKKCIIATPDNNTVFRQVLIPFNTVLSTFQYLDTVYGVYKNGMKVFFDLNTNYILNAGMSKLSDLSLSKDIIIDIPSTSTIASYDLKDNTIVAFGKDVSYSSQSKLKSEYTGTNNTFVLNDSNIINKSWNTDLTDKQKVYYQKYSNPFVSNQLNPTNDTIIIINTQNANYNYINFINNYQISEYKQSVFKDQNIQLIKYNHKFVRTRNNIFELYSSMEFKKV